MSFFDRFRRDETRASIDNPAVPLSVGGMLTLVGQGSADLPRVTPDSAMTVPAVAGAVTFLSGSLANLPLHLFKDKGADGVDRDRSDLSKVLNEAANDEWSSFAARRYFWSQVFGSPGRGLFWIERTGPKVHGLWPMDASATVVPRVQGRRGYRYDGKTYAASEVVDVPFLLKSDQLSSHSAFTMAAPAIQQALAMRSYAAGFFAGGGVPPLALTGPMPAGAEAVKRAQADIKRAIAAAKTNSEAVFPIPAGYELKPVGFDPDKGQMTDAFRFQVEEFARVWGLPPVFLQDLTHGTHTNTEQQDLFLVKHLISRWAKALEDELNLKLFGARRNKRYAEHNLDGLMRGDLLSRMTALAKGVQTALISPNEGRALDNRGPKEGGDVLYIQGATVPLGTSPKHTPPVTGDQNED